MLKQLLNVPKIRCRHRNRQAGTTMTQQTDSFYKEINNLIVPLWFVRNVDVFTIFS